MKTLCEKDIFHGLSLPNNGPIQSNFIYADDIMILGEWSPVNILNIKRIIRCFYLSSGLNVIYNKTKVFGIETKDVQITNLENHLNCDL